MNAAHIPHPTVPRLRPATLADAIAGALPQHVAEPATAEELAALLKWADEHRLKVAARGGGSKLDWGNPLQSLDWVISTAALNRVVEHAFDDMTATVEAGCIVADFQRQLAQHGQRLALDPLFPEQATIGGVLAANDSGPLRLRFGSLRDLIIGITVALPDGTLARSGGKVVKNVAGYDLPKLFTGSLGTLGIITQATFRLHPLPHAAETRTLRFAGVRQANDFLLELLDSTLAPAAVQLRAGRGRETSMDIRYECVSAGLAAQVRRTEAMAPGCELASPEVWNAREGLWMRTGDSCIAKFGVLPAELGALCERLDQLVGERTLDWLAVAQATGTGLVRLEGAPDRLGPVALELRAELEHGGGSLVVLRCPEQLHRTLDRWGSAGTALPLMRRVKKQFDPASILNPGRFVGGI